MFNIPSIKSSTTHRWLNVEQSGGQENTEKRTLRLKFRKERENHKRNCELSDLPWGANHISRLMDFLNQHFGGLSSPSRPWPMPWTAYFPIGSELNLLGHCPMDHCWLPCDQPNGELLWFPWSIEIGSWRRDSKTLPRPPAEIPLKRFNPSLDGPWIVITPCLAADLNGIRLGYGGGYYDRFLSEHKENIFSVACLPSSFLLAAGHLPKESFDEAVDCLVTEDSVLLLAPEKFNRIKAQLLKRERG